MKHTLLASVMITTVFAAAPVLAHHPAADIVDPAIYERIDKNVSGTPHADMSFEDMGRNMDEREDRMQQRSEMAPARGENATESHAERADGLASRRAEERLDAEETMVMIEMTKTPTGVPAE